jgi:two-component system, cell cycle sensor histidine kinase and response regulator CckA
VITDYTMPLINGVDISREIMNIRPDIPVILCSGYSEEVTPDEARAAGIREFFLKPLAIWNLAEVVRKTLDSEASQVSLVS